MSDSHRSPNQHIGAITFYTEVMGFALIEDVVFRDLYGNRWDLLELTRTYPGKS